MHLDGSNAENKISLLVILCIIMYVKKKKTFFFFTKSIMVKCLNIGKNIGKPIYRSISNKNICMKQIADELNETQIHSLPAGGASSLSLVFGVNIHARYADCGCIRG